MKWWQWIFIVLLVGAVGILSKFVWTQFGPPLKEPFQSTPIPKWNGLNLLQSNRNTIAAPTGGFSRYTIFDMERVEVQRKILEYEFSLFRYLIWQHETSYRDYVITRNTGREIFSRFLMSDRMSTGTASSLTDNDQIQTMRILFSYLYVFSNESPFEFAIRGYNGFDNDRTDLVNLDIVSRPDNISDRFNINNYNLALTGIEDYIMRGMLENIQKEFDLDALKHPIGYLLNGKKSVENMYPPGSAPILYTNLQKYMLSVIFRGYDKFSIMKYIWACPATPMFGKPASRIVDRFINRNTSHGYFLTFCSFDPDQMEGFEFETAYYKDASLLNVWRAIAKLPLYSADKHQAAVRRKLTGGQVQQRGFKNHTPQIRGETSLDMVQVDDQDIKGYNIQYPARFKEGAYITTNILSDPLNWNETGLPKSIFKYAENGQSNAYVSTLIGVFNASKGGVKENYPWRGVDVSGTISEANIDEITKSISICLPLNFSDPMLAERQMRIAPDERFYISPTFNAKPEYKNRITDINGISTMVLERDQAAVDHNDKNCNVEVTSTMLGLIPYNARRFMMSWGDVRAERIKKFNTQGDQSRLDTTVKTVSNIYIRPTFDLASAGDPSLSNVISVEDKKAILNSMAQLHYDQNEGKTRIKVFHDVYQVGQTIFDARYQVQEKRSSTVQAKITNLTAEYESIRNGVLTVDEANRLELSYQQKLSELYEEEENNLENTGFGCAPRARFIQITSGETGKRICLSQVRASNNEGKNVAMFGMVTTLSPVNTKLFPGEEASGLQSGFDGRIMSVERSNAFNASRNNAARESKLTLLTDGILRPRTVPNYYESNVSTPTDFVRVNIGYEEEITNVQLILPQILPGDAAKVLRIKVFRDAASQIGREITVTLSETDPLNRVVEGSFINANADPRCANRIADTFRVARFYATIDGTGLNADGRPDITKLRFTGFTESRRLDTAAALSFNPLYNCGFDLAIDAEGGGQVWRPQIKYTRNFQNLAQASITCSNPAVVKTILSEYRLSQRAQGFDSRRDVVALPAAKAYSFMDTNYTPSTVTAWAQINPSTCGYTFQELTTDMKTNRFKGMIERTGTFVMTPDMENWFSQKLIYNIPSSLMFATPEDYAARFPAAQLTPFTTPVPLPIPIHPRVRLDDANGACPEKYCSDLDVINQLVIQYNNVQAGEQTRTRQILRVNRAVSGGGLTGSTKQCDYEAVFGIYTDSSAPAETTFTSTISLFTTVQPNSGCSYRLTGFSEPGYGHFADANQPLLSKIYTYATEVITPYYKDLMSAVAGLLGKAEAQTTEGTAMNVTTGLRTYRADVLASYAALKQLDGCPPTETNNRCNSQMITQGFIQNYQLNTTADEYITKVLRAGTASGSECDFTFETNAGTRGARCKMVKDPNFCAFSFDSAYSPAEVYHVSTLSTAFTFQQAFDTCRSLGAELATTNQVNHALRIGADWCGVAGFVLDAAPDGALQAISPCGATRTLSTIRLGPLSTIGGANCYGPKPGTGGKAGRILPFSTTVMNAPAQQFIQGCVETIPMPPTTDDLVDLGFKPNMVSPLSVAASTSMSTIQIPPTVADVISPRDFIDCASAYAIATADTVNPTAFAGFYAAATQSVEAIDTKTCLYNSTIQATFVKRGNIYQAPTVQLSARRTVNAANVRTIVPKYTTRPLVSGVAIVSDADCSGAALLNASGLRSSVIDARRSNATTCEYRVAKSEFLPFGNTFKQVSFSGAAGAPFMLSTAPSTEAASNFRFKPDLGTVGAAAFKRLVDLFKTYWNSKFYDNTLPTDTVFRNRIGTVLKIAYSTTDDTVFFMAQNAEYGPLGDLDIRFFSNEQYFRVVFRKPHAKFFTTDFADAFVFSAERVTQKPSLTFVNYSDTTPPTLVSAQDTLTNNSRFRLLRFKNMSTGPVELLRLNFYEVDSNASGTFSCDTENTAMRTIRPTRAYVTVTEITKNRDLRLKSYLLPSARVCEPEYDQVTDPVSFLEKCLLNPTKITTEDRRLYEYTTVPNKPCGIGYTQTPKTTQCVLNYDFNAILQPYCNANPSTQSSRLDLAPGQSIVIYLNDTFKVDGFTITTGSATKHPTQWQLDGSINGNIWANLHTQSAAYTFVDAGASPQGQFVTSELILWKTNAKFPTTPLRRPTGTDGVIEPFQTQTLRAATKGEPRPSWFRIRVLDTLGPSKFASMGGPLLFLTPSGYIDPTLVAVTNFGGSRRDPKEGPDALLATTGGRHWVDYNKAPLIFRLPAQREAIRGFRFGAPQIAEATPSDWVLEGSWDGRVWNPIGEQQTPDRLVVRFDRPF